VGFEQTLNRFGNRSPVGTTGKLHPHGQRTVVGEFDLRSLDTLDGGERPS
jgi:hypothetical protein